MPQQGTPERGKPRTEPEIIPPNRRFERPEGGSGIRVFVIGRRTYFAKPGPLTALVATIVLGALLVITLVIVLGASGRSPAKNCRWSSGEPEFMEDAAHCNLNGLIVGVDRFGVV
jgi:hypothetical protein